MNIIQDIPSMSDDTLVILKTNSTNKKIRTAVIAELALRRIEMGWQRAPLDVSSDEDDADWDVDDSHTLPYCDDDFLPYGEGPDFYDEW